MKQIEMTEEILAAQKKMDRYRVQMEEIILTQTSRESVKSKQKLDRRAKEKLESLGYISSSRDSTKKISVLKTT